MAFLENERRPFVFAVYFCLIPAKVPYQAKRIKTFFVYNYILALLYIQKKKKTDKVRKKVLSVYLYVLENAIIVGFLFPTN